MRQIKTVVLKLRHFHDKAAVYTFNHSGWYNGTYLSIAYVYFPSVCKQVNNESYHVYHSIGHLDGCLCKEMCSCVTVVKTAYFNCAA